MSPQRYRWHRCKTRHLSGASFARCVFPGWMPVRGAGQWAVVSRCLVPSVTLFASKRAATAEFERLENEPCDMNCSRQHEFAFIDLLNAQTDLAPRPSEVA